VQEESDCLTCFFAVPDEGVPDEGRPLTVEISLYDLGSGTIALSLEADAAYNQAAWDDACELAEDLADALGATTLDL